MSMASSAERLSALNTELAAMGLEARAHSAPGLGPAYAVDLTAAQWGRLAKPAQAGGWRWAAGWGEDLGATMRVSACLEKGGTYLLARTEVSADRAEVASHAAVFPLADRPERHTRDLLGIGFDGHPDSRRWTRHQAWDESQRPLRHDHAAAGAPPPSTPTDHEYRFLSAHGAGVYEIPVGPVHAGIIEPGHFRFQAVGETVLHLEERLGYVHKGIEKIAEGRDADGLARLAGRVSGDSTVAHAWAACMAMERAAGTAVPERALGLRALMCERERVANHLGDIGAILNDIAYTFGYYQFGRLREAWQRRSQEAFGHRFMMDGIVPGGTAVDVDPAAAAAMPAEAAALRRELDGLIAIVSDSGSVEDRLVGAGVLSPAQAAALGCMGFVGRASSVDFDVRRDAAYAPYAGLPVTVPVYHYGDIAARMRVRVEEIRASLELLGALLARLAPGPHRADWRAPAAGAEGLGVLEGWRGEILTYVRFAGNGKVARFFPRDPSWTTWPALELLIHDNIVPDFPVCNKSVNGSYSGHDL